jgi:Domain of unknown function (DUF4440)
MTLDPDTLRTIERTRLASLVAGDLAVADTLHANHYQLITPRGRALSKSEYLGAVASHELHYQVFEPTSEIEVWGDDRIAMLRYRAAIGFHGSDDVMSVWHTDCYEADGDGWRVVWSQATAIESDEPATKVVAGAIISPGECGEDDITSANLEQMADTLTMRPPTDADRRELVEILRWLARLVREMETPTNTPIDEQ